MQIIAVSNIKGGVGKTTTAVNLAYLSAAAGRPTLLWDLDPQGAATWLLRGLPQDAIPLRKLVSGKRELAELVFETGHDRLHLLPADLSYRHFDVVLGERKKPSERLLRMARPLAELYGTLVLDCPPGLSLLSESVLHAADAVVVPLLPTPLSVRMLDELRAFLAREGWSDVRLLPFFSMVDRRKSLHVSLVESTRAAIPGILATEVPYWSEIERMALRRAPLPAYAPGSASAAIYAALWSEVAAALPSPAAWRASA